MSTKILVIDPGVPFGWALFEGDQLIKHFRCSQTTAKTWEEKTDRAALQLISTIALEKPDHVYCEQPFYIPGHAAADSGALVKLSIVVGRFMQIVRGHYKLPWDTIRVNDWMGQMDDRAIRYRAIQVLGEEVVKGIAPHAIDAVCIGLYIVGRWPQ